MNIADAQAVLRKARAIRDTGSSNAAERMLQHGDLVDALAFHVQRARLRLEARTEIREAIRGLRALLTEVRDQTEACDLQPGTLQQFYAGYRRLNTALAALGDLV